MVVPPPPPAARHVPRKRKGEVWHWQYCGGETQAAQWKWFDEKISKLLEEAWRDEAESIVVHNDWNGQAEYNFHTMVGKNLPLGMEKSISWQIQRVLYKDEI